ncbi:MAG: asparagine synthetase B, partial [Deltaproteobacteria bacterium]|nr:asparagine synthetase B [Deltaproteobacteria bacterium]
MLHAIRHRGPDDEGLIFISDSSPGCQVFGGQDTPAAVYEAPLPYAPRKALQQDHQVAAHLALGHRRLSILDLTPTGHQPMTTTDGRFWIVFNGEIYNYQELRQELIKSGRVFISGSDTEVLLQGYAQWGTEVFSRLIGMFAFALYDRQQRELILARDFFGIKPLYYTLLPHGMAFASEIKALCALPEIDRRANPQRVFDYLRFGLTDYGHETLWSEIHQIPPAHYLIVPWEQNG